MPLYGNLVPRAFPSKMGGAAFSRPTYFKYFKCWTHLFLSQFAFLAPYVLLHRKLGQINDPYIAVRSALPSSLSVILYCWSWSIARLESEFHAVDSGLWIPGTGFHESLSVDLRFWIPIASGIPYSLSCFPDSKAQDSRFHQQKFRGFRNSDRPLHGATRGQKTS